MIIFTTRLEVHEIRVYLQEQGIPFDYINHNPVNVELDCHPSKVMADVYIDDRAITFEGEWSDKFLDKIVNFKPYYKR